MKSGGAVSVTVLAVILALFVADGVFGAPCTDDVLRFCPLDIEDGVEEDKEKTLCALSTCLASNKAALSDGCLAELEKYETSIPHPTKFPNKFFGAHGHGRHQEVHGGWGMGRRGGGGGGGGRRWLGRHHQHHRARNASPAAGDFRNSDQKAAHRRRHHRRHHHDHPGDGNTQDGGHHAAHGRRHHRRHNRSPPPPPPAPPAFLPCPVFDPAAWGAADLEEAYVTINGPPTRDGNVDAGRGAVEAGDFHAFQDMNKVIMVAVAGASGLLLLALGFWCYKRRQSSLASEETLQRMHAEVAAPPSIFAHQNYVLLSSSHEEEALPPVEIYPAYDNHEFHNCPLVEGRVTF